MHSSQIIVIGAGIGGLTTAALLAQAGYRVTVLEAQMYAGGCAGTFSHQGYRFDAGATVAGGFQPNGPHARVGEKLGIEWPVRQHDPAWVVHLPDREIVLQQDQADVLKQFPDSAPFWTEQRRLADLSWKLSAQGLPWPPGNGSELAQLARGGWSSFPENLRMLPFAFGNVAGWIKRHGLADDRAFVRFIDAQLLIAAQTTSPYTNALYGATALDLPRQGVYHLEGGIGSLAETLVQAIQEHGGEVLFRQRVAGMKIEQGRVQGVTVRKGKHSSKEIFFPADFVVANLTPWSLDTLLGDDSPRKLRREIHQREDGWGAFVLYLGVQADKLPPKLPDHHQIITTMTGDLGEGQSIFVSLSPEWDTSRAPEGQRAVTVTTHTVVKPWWDLLEQDETAYPERKAAYTAMLLDAIDNVIPGFHGSVKFSMSGTPVTYNSFTHRYRGMVGGFPQTSLLRVRGPRTGLANLRLVGDSIFPGQSTAGVTLGAMRVADDIMHHLPLRVVSQSRQQIPSVQS